MKFTVRVGHKFRKMYAGYQSRTAVRGILTVRDSPTCSDDRQICGENVGATNHQPCSITPRGGGKDTCRPADTIYPAQTHLFYSSLSTLLAKSLYTDRYDLNHLLAEHIIVMSVTLTENRVTYSFARTLADYDLRHSDDLDCEAVLEEPNARPKPEETGQNPSDWEENFRRVPEYRPIDHTLDFAYRNTYSNNIERVFLWNMFTGIRLVSVRVS